LGLAVDRLDHASSLYNLCSLQLCNFRVNMKLLQPSQVEEAIFSALKYSNLVTEKDPRLTHIVARNIGFA
jgi:hypothetical protein